MKFDFGVSVESNSGQMYQYIFVLMHILGLCSTSPIKRIITLPLGIVKKILPLKYQRLYLLNTGMDYAFGFRFSFEINPWNIFIDPV